MLFLDALLHICVLIRRVDNKEIIDALLSGLTGVTVLILVPLKEIAFSLLHSGHDAVFGILRSLFLAVTLVVGLVVILGGLLVLRDRLE